MSSDACPLPENADLPAGNFMAQCTDDGSGQADPLPERMGSDAESVLYRPDRAACDDGHVGPFIEQPILSDWLYRLCLDVPVLPQYRCLSCGSDRGFTVEELRRGR